MKSIKLYRPAFVCTAALCLGLSEGHAAGHNYCTYVPLMETTAVNDAEGQRECRAWLKSAGLKTDAQARRAQEHAGEEVDAAGVATRNLTNNSSAIQQAVAAAHNGLLTVMKDPDSAKFNPHDGEAYSLNANGSLYAVCGGVNSKNGFGGYTGEQTWIYVLPKNIIYTQETGVTAAMVRRDCTGRVAAR